MVLFRFISFRTKFKTLLFLQRFRNNPSFENPHQNKKKIFFFLAADYGNLGDVAITAAQTRFLSDHYPDYQLLEIPISKTLQGIRWVSQHIGPHDIISLVGGGNMGNHYEQIEILRQIVIQRFRNNRIISFPQTFDFTKDAYGKKEMDIAVHIYNRHPSLTLLAREKKSYELMKFHFPKCEVLLTPDIVMYLDERQPVAERKGAVFCLRNDSEKLLTDRDEQNIRFVVSEHFGEVLDYDTHISKSKMSMAERKYELEQIWRVFRSAQLVITDRLHGMIFCYITGTPCIVFNNNNHKVKGCHQWIADKSNIFLMEDYSKGRLVELLTSQFYKNRAYEALSEEFAKINLY